jgi:ATP-binding cassette subfamily B protein
MLLDRKPQIVDEEASEALKVNEGSIRFENVSFAYNQKRRILNTISFSIKAGSKVAVVGESGSGKSTLVKLLFRFYELDSGNIFIDEQNIGSVTQDSLRASIGIVPQDTVLFNDTLYENIRYGRPQASEQDIADAIKLAHLDQFIAKLPDGHATQVGERGLKLSGGEKQRVAIARAILKRPPIMVFDEATSSLDSQSEQSILSALKELAQGHTSLMIAHRLSTIIDADQILVMHQGNIVESGTHENLLASDGHYAKLWQAQQKKQSASASK